MRRPPDPARATAPSWPAGGGAEISMGTGIKDQQYTSPRVVAFTVGDLVRAEPRSRPVGTWPRYSGRVGTVVTVNRQRFNNGAPDYVEIGVRFGASNDESTTWFRPTELVADGRATGATLPSDGRNAARAMATAFMSGSLHRRSRRARERRWTAASRDAGCICTPKYHTLPPDAVRELGAVAAAFGTHETHCPIAVRVIATLFPRCER
jgi:hypothetical protein